MYGGFKSRGFEKCGVNGNPLLGAKRQALWSSPCHLPSRTL
jgi:hypothetical protein